MSAKPPGVNAVLQAVDRRGETDERPAYFTHVVLPVLLVLIGALGAVGIVLSTSGFRGSVDATVAAASDSVLGLGAMLVGLGALVGGVLFVIGFYKVARRRNGHFARDELLREGLIDYARWLAASRSSDRASEHLESMERIHRDARLQEPRRPAAVHLLLIVLFPLWYLYVVYYLTKDVADHARRQARFLRETRSVVEEAGLEVDEVEDVPTVSERSYLLTLLLVAIVPFGNFVVLYWLYNDPEQHFDNQWRHEDALVDLLSEQETDGPAVAHASEETDAPEDPDVDPSTSPDVSEQRPEGADAEEDTAPEEEPEFTVWACSECGKRYKVPPKRPVRVTCQECEHQEVLEE